MYDAGACSRTRKTPIPGGLWQRGSVQLGGGLLFAVVLPSSTAAAIEPLLLQLDLFATSILGNFAAAWLGFWLFRNLIAFPGIRASYYVLPVFASTFVAVFVVLFMLRLHYSRPLLITGFGLSVAWYYLVYFMIQRQQQLSIAVVPMGGVDSLYPIDSIDWTRLNRPEFPRHCTTLVADFDYDLPPEWERFLAECALAGISVVHYKQLRQSLTGQVQMERLSENAFGSLIPNPTYLTAKQILDGVVALALLPLALPTMLVIALAVKADSPGPIFFRQRRVGYRGRIFTVWKFRTMYLADTDSVGQQQIAITTPNDPRITRLGRHLRRQRIDELPQIFNILRGEMSWIGPRPEAEALSQWYEREIPFYRYRHIVRPGVSGWAQVNQGHVTGIDDVMRKLSYDFFYISRFTFWLDMLIVVRTIKTILTGFGSR
ncbi:sugar transferase [Sphingomonas sp. 37zxx]|uniref:sugar transferase n=1 Tax=Sphingomonas sp. 37zxx TaxID=1550073 RepID=UPI00068FD0FB|nr:sugar transferase [Sphingomonas sp. 37zxx]